jgi:hypothetical protein
MSTPDDTAAKRAELEADIAKSAGRVMRHMNNDHEDSIVAYVLAFASGVEGTDPLIDKEEILLKNFQKGRLAIVSAQMTTVDADGFLVEVKAIEEVGAAPLVLSNVRVPYDEPIKSAKDLHHTAVSMHRKAYDKLGVWYKTKNGYYKQVLKMVAFQSYKAIQKSPTFKAVQDSAPSSQSMVVGAATLAAATVAAGYLRSRAK